MGVKIAGIVVAGVALVLAQTSFESLILFAINSFHRHVITITNGGSSNGARFR